MPNDESDDDCMDNDKGLIESLKDCIDPGEKSGIDKRDDR